MSGSRVNVVEQTANTSVFVGASTAVVAGGLTLSDLAALVGVGVAVLGLFVNWYYKHKTFKLAARKARGESECPDM